MSDLSKHIATMAEQSAIAAVRSGAFDEALEGIIIDTLRKRDDGLSRIGFILKMAVEMIDKCSRPMRLQEAKRLAKQAYASFRAENDMVKFGDPAFDWSGASARLLANEYETDYWESLNG